MTQPEKTKLLRTNTILWLVAMLLPGVLHLALASTRFPWPVILPLLLIGPLLTKASGEKADDPGRR